MLAALGHYKILERIGAGRMGELLRARDTRAGRTVAVRVVADEIAGNPDHRRRFLDAARATGVLSHPNIAALYEIGDDQGRLFLVFEFVPGETLRTVLAGRALNLRHALDHGIQLAEALADAHSRGILHRDIRPGTIIVTPKGFAKFVDFGLSAWTAGGAERARAAGGGKATIETAAYMSPEQMCGEPEDEHTDIFSLGAVLFEMLVGKPPHGALTAQALASPILGADTRARGATNRARPAELDGIVRRMLATSCDERYESAATVAAELRAVVAILDVREDAGESPPGAPTTSRRMGRGPLIIFLLLALCVLAAVVYLW